MGVALRAAPACPAAKGFAAPGRVAESSGVVNLRAKMPFVRVTEVAAAVAGVTWMIELDRAEKLNCLNLAMLKGLRAALNGSTAARVILTGTGRAFCTGLDLDEVAKTDGGREHLRRLVAVYRWLLETSADTVALARGYAVGGGAGLLTCAKRVVVASDFRFRLPGGKLSALAAVVLPVCRLRAGERQPDRSGWLGCDLDAGEAQRLGLVDWVVSPNELDDLISAARSGSAPLELCAPVVRDAAATAVALEELEQFA